MGDRWDSEWAAHTERYTQKQIERVVTDLGMSVVSDTHNDFLCYCPYHQNRDTPSFSVSKTSGKFICFNPSCMEKGDIYRLIVDVKRFSHFQAVRFLHKRKQESKHSIQQAIQNRPEKQYEFATMNPQDILRLSSSFWDKDEAVSYMMDTRGFSEDTLRHFQVGYSDVKDMITVPMHCPKGDPIGLIGRSLADKRFKNSYRLPVSKTLWNFHRAKRHGPRVIVCEASFDGMSIYQAGFSNVVGLLGGNLSVHHIELLNKHFDEILIMTDWDDKESHTYTSCRKCPGACEGHNPGRDLGNTIASKLSHKRILWASTGYKQVYPEGIKDANGMTGEQIRTCVKNAVSNFEYSSWRLT